MSAVLFTVPRYTNDSHCEYREWDKRKIKKLSGLRVVFQSERPSEQRANQRCLRRSSNGVHVKGAWPLVTCNMRAYVLIGKRNLARM